MLQHSILMLYLPSLVYWSLNKAKRDTAALFWAFQLPSSCMSSPQVSKSQKKGGEEREKKKKKTPRPQVYTLPCVVVVFMWSQTLMFASQVPWPGWGVGPRLEWLNGCPMKRSTTVACCVCLPFRPAAWLVERDRKREGGRERVSGRPDLTGGGGHGCTSCQLCQKTANHCSWFSGRFEGGDRGLHLLCYNFRLCV